MLSRQVGTARRGLTLVELMAATAIAGVVLAVIAGIALRQQRTFLALSNEAALAGQLRDAAAMLPADLRIAAVGAGDLREATDTSIEIRETIVSAVGCDTLGAAIVLAPTGGGATTYASTVAAAQPGDTVWLLATDDSAPAWRPRRVTGIAATRAGQCLGGGPQLDGLAIIATRTALSLDSAPPALTLIGLPLRITRPIRYSAYRSADGRWYLGVRDWNNATARFNSIQPVAGPFQPPGSGAPLFRWFDTTGAPLVAPVVAPDRVALARIELRGQTRTADQILGSSRDTGPRADSASISVSMRNR